MSGLTGYLLGFAGICAVVAVVCSTYRHRDPRLIVRESIGFFTILVAGIAIFSLIVYLLEWAFIHRP